LRRVLIILFSCYSLAAVSGNTVEDSILSGGIYRKYRLYIPSLYNGSSKVPLVFNLHGTGATAIQQQYYGNFMSIADTAGFLVVHPQGTSSNPYWNTGLANSPDDVKFLNELLDTLSLNYQVDAERVYCCGFSNGGVMSNYLACQSYGRFAAIAEVSGTMLTNWFFTCKPARALPVLKIHGTSDNTIPYTGSGLYVAADSIVWKWIRHNDCNRTPQTTSIPDTSSSDFSSAVRYRYSGGTDGASVEYYKISNGGHAWPNATQWLDITNRDFDASTEIWRFFRPYRLGQFSTKVSLTEQHESGWIILRDRVLIPKPVAYSVYSINGELVRSGYAEREIAAGELPAGCYFVTTDEGRTIRFIKVPE
jgi:polyhydroxybutyrate depolymerase